MSKKISHPLSPEERRANLSEKIKTSLENKRIWGDWSNLIVLKASIPKKMLVEMLFKTRLFPEKKLLGVCTHTTLLQILALWFNHMTKRGKTTVPRCFPTMYYTGPFTNNQILERVLWIAPPLIDGFEKLFKQTNNAVRDPISEQFALLGLNPPHGNPVVKPPFYGRGHGRSYGNRTWRRGQN